jgi:hypothetical protein
MPTREIPRGEWGAFLDAFSRQHRGWLVSIDVLGIDIGAQPEARDVPLEGTTFDHESDLIVITAGRDAARVTHSVRDPLNVRLRQAEDGADEALQIESTAGERTIVRFRATARPEMVDGL